MKLLAVVFVITVTSQWQTLALPTYGNGAKIVFSEDNNVYPTNGANGQRIEFSEQNKAKSLEEALYTYTELLKGLNSRIHSDRTNDVASDQTTTLCSNKTCDCSQLKYGDFKGTNSENGDSCTVFSIPYCEGVCYAHYKYYIALQYSLKLFISPSFFT